jgi:hypothetical protein
MVLLIVLIGVAGGVMRARYRSVDYGSGEIRNSAAQAENQQLREELRAMKERLAVLERLATDNNDSGARLDREIEKLRDRS